MKRLAGYLYCQGVPLKKAAKQSFVIRVCEQILAWWRKSVATVRVAIADFKQCISWRDGVVELVDFKEPEMFWRPKSA
ncbi:MAG: hypothetical protein EXS51_04265 [Candidatus Taylorbacteria bacterium]|nr:hypothetical protein [Candidatus Taylorbacteria bacterium]